MGYATKWELTYQPYESATLLRGLILQGFTTFTTTVVSPENIMINHWICAIVPHPNWIFHGESSG